MLQEISDDEYSSLEFCFDRVAGDLHKCLHGFCRACVGVQNAVDARRQHVAGLPGVVSHFFRRDGVGGQSADD